MNPTLKRHIQSFRVRELQDVLERLGHHKKGRKLELQARLLAVFEDASALHANGYQPMDHARITAAAKLVEDTYYGMMGLRNPNSGSGGGAQVGALDASAAKRQRTDGGPAAAAAAAATSANGRPGGGGVLAAAPPSVNNSSSDLLDALLDSSANLTMIRCICNHNVDRGGAMLQCGGCGVWQHSSCMAASPQASSFFCEQCTVARADPFWEVWDPKLMLPSKLAPNGRTISVGTQHAPVMATSRSINLTPAQVDLLRRKGDHYKLQVVCILLDDPVPFRLHWPLAADLRINNMGYKVYGRLPATKLGAGGRDEAAVINPLVRPGINQVLLTTGDSRPFLLLAAMVKRRTAAAVKLLMMPPESLADAVACVQQVLRGGDSGDDDDVVIANSVVSLKDPLTGTRIATPAHFTDELTIAAFDLDPFLTMAARTRKWQDPNSMRNSCVQRLQVDAYLNRILQLLGPYPDVTEVEVQPDATWRPAGSSAPFLSVLDSDADATQKLAGALQPGGAAKANGVGAAARGGQLAIKSDPDGGRGAAEGAAGGGAEDSDEEEDPVEELRRAAAAVSASTRRPPPPARDVIDLISSDDEDATPAAQAPAAPAPPGAAAAARRQPCNQAGGGLTIRLPARRPNPQQYADAFQHVSGGPGGAASAGGSSASDAVRAVVQPQQQLVAQLPAPQLQQQQLPLQHLPMQQLQQQQPMQQQHPMQQLPQQQMQQLTQQQVQQLPQQSAPLPSWPPSGAHAAPAAAAGPGAAPASASAAGVGVLGAYHPAASPSIGLAAVVPVASIAASYVQPMAQQQQQQGQPVDALAQYAPPAPQPQQPLQQPPYAQHGHGVQLAQQQQPFAHSPVPALAHQAPPHQHQAALPFQVPLQQQAAYAAAAPLHPQPLAHYPAAGQPASPAQRHEQHPALLPVAPVIGQVALGGLHPQPPQHWANDVAQHTQQAAVGGAQAQAAAPAGALACAGPGAEPVRAEGLAPPYLPPLPEPPAASQPEAEAALDDVINLCDDFD